MADYDKTDEKETYGAAADLERHSSEESIQKGDLLSLEHVDPALNAKMHLVNDTIDEIGFTRYQWKLFFLNGFGYAVDSLILLLQSIIAPYAEAEFHPSFAYGMTVAVYVGMLVGALFWGLSADVIGRKYAFNFSLLISSIFCIVAGASPNWIVLGLFISLAAFGSGGNLVLDTTVFLEYLPSQDQWLLTLMACWWGAGQFVAGLWAWAFLPNYSCPAALGSKTGLDIPCNWHTNPGWRYVWFASGAIVLVMSLARVTVINLRETPKFLVGEGKDAEVVDTMQYIAKRYNRPCSLTLERMEACGATGGALPAGRRGSVSAHAAKKFSFNEVWMHLKGLFATKKLGLSTALIWWSWTLIGLAYPLYAVPRACEPGRRLLIKWQVQRLFAHLSPNARRRTRRPEPREAVAVLCRSKPELHSLPRPCRVYVQEPLFLGPSRYHDHRSNRHDGFLLRLHAGAE